MPGAKNTATVSQPFRNRFGSSSDNAGENASGAKRPHAMRTECGHDADKKRTRERVEKEKEKE